MSEPSIPEIPPAATETPRRRYRTLAIALGAALVVQLAVIAAVPFWAPPLLPLLPWAGAPDAKLVQRIKRLETGYDQQRQATTQNVSAVEQLGRRIGGVEAKQNEERQSAAKVASAVQQLDPRIAAIEAAQKQDQQNTLGAASTLKQLDSRVAALEAKPETPAKDLADLRQQLQTLSSASSALSARIEALEKSARAQSATDSTETALMLALLQVRDAVQTARPFSAEYGIVAALARDRPEIAEAAAPLAQAAQTGVASRAVLAQRLHELAASITNAQVPPTEPDWGSEALARLRGLVSIRRIGGAGQSAPEAAVSAAETALAAGDLTGAIAALDKLTGAAADAARPWLLMARERQSVEAALRRVEALLVARLGKPSEANAPSGPSR